MRFFVCILDPVHATVPEMVRRPYESLPCKRGLPFQWYTFRHAAVLLGGDGGGVEPAIVTDDGWLAVGTVRLDNRADLERSAGCRGGGLSDLALVLRAVMRHRASCIGTMLGDFGFVVWQPETRTAIAARDVVGARKVFYATRTDVFAFGSRAECLACEERYDKQYLAERIASCLPSAGLTPFVGVRAVPAATVAVVDQDHHVLRQYWSPDEFEPTQSNLCSVSEAADTCRELLADAIRLRLGGADETWSQLSGGLDSSSVVSVAQWLFERGRVAHGLAGTVTYVDRVDTASDERVYSDAVVERWRVRNEMIIEAPVWHDDEYDPPHIDQPRPDFMFFPRERRLCAMMRQAGGRILLTGIGSDEMLTGNMLFFADWLVRGRVGAALGEMARWAAIGRASFWELAYRNVVLPLLPEVLRARAVHDEMQMPPWMLPTAVRTHGLRARHFDTRLYGGRWGHKYGDMVRAGLMAVSGLLYCGLLEDELDVRHPFLYRPFLEFALQLPPDLCAQPCERKWLLREAMRGILPEHVRTRVAKGSMGERFAWSLVRQRSMLTALASRPILADLGLIDATKLRVAIDDAAALSDRKDQPHALIQNTLAVETWLQMRSGDTIGAGHPTWTQHRRAVTRGRTHPISGCELVGGYAGSERQE